MNDFNRKEQEKHYQSIIGLGDDQWDSIDIAKELTDRDETIHKLQTLVDELAEIIRKIYRTPLDDIYKLSSDVSTALAKVKEFEG